MRSKTKARMAEMDKIIANLDQQEYVNRLKEMNPDVLKNHIEQATFLMYLPFRNPYDSLYFEHKFKMEFELKNMGNRIPWKYLRSIAPEERQTMKLFLKFIDAFKTSYFLKVNSSNYKLDKYICEIQHRQAQYCFNALLGRRRQKADSYVLYWHIDYFSIQEIKVIFSNYYFYYTLQELLNNEEFTSFKILLQNIENDVESKFSNYYNLTNDNINNVLHKSVSRTANGITQKISISSEMQNTLSSERKLVEDFLTLKKNLFKMEETKEVQASDLLKINFEVNAKSYLKQKVVPGVYNAILLHSEIKKHRQLITYDLIANFGNLFNDFLNEEDFKSKAYKDYSKTKIENIKIQRIKRIIELNQN